MKAPRFTPAYTALYPMLCDVARSQGYALAIHGSVSSDMDLLAVPWTENPSSPARLMHSVAEYVGAVMSTEQGDGTPLRDPEIKPHGRQAWAIPIGNGAVLDLSVMPTRSDV